MEFYREVRTRPWTGGLRYFLVLMAVLAVVMTLALGPVVYVGLRGIGHYVEGKIPDGSSVTVSRGQLSAALPMPFVLFEEASTVPFPNRQKIVLDTAVTGLGMPRETIGENGVLIGRDAVFLRSPAEERTYPLKNFPDLSLNKRQVTDWVGRHVLPVSLSLTVGLGLLYLLVVVFGNLAFVLFGSLLIRIFARILKVTGPDFRQWLACGLYAVTWPLFLSAVFNALGLRAVPVFPVVFFMIMASVLADERNGGAKPALPENSADG